jgi:hypothetical protein
LGSLPTTPSRSASRNDDESYVPVEVPFARDKAGVTGY